MKGRMIDTGKILAAALVCGLLATAVLAHGSGHGQALLEEGSVTKIEVAVWEPESRDEIAQLQLGDTLELHPGQSVLVRLYAPRGHGPGDQRNYLPARFYVAKGQGAEVTAAEPEKGLYRVTAAKTRGMAEIRYELGRGIAVDRPFMRDHFIKVDVAAPAIVPAVPQPDAALLKAHAMVARLYRGILLRDVQREKGEGDEWVELVYRGGYPAVVDVAREIAESEESRLQVIRRGHTLQNRLEALYLHLLDVEREQIDRYQWQDHFAMIARGGYTDVVTDIVRSPEFRRVHGYN